jgi:riboflavin biosynthesis pyrimidine reductase
MDGEVLQLFPLPTEEKSLNGLYLSHNLRQKSETTGQTFLYSNFITSLDGRIAIAHPTRPGLMVPKSTANERDWRLFQELATQADMVISSGRYLRDWEDGRAQEILEVDDPRFEDLRQWRTDQGLPPQPDIAIISGSLRFPVPDILTEGGRKVIVITMASADKERAKLIESKGADVYIAGEDSVDGKKMVQIFTDLGYKTVYSSAGPKIHHLLIEAKVLDRTYLTFASRILGSPTYSTIVEGHLFEPAVDMTLSHLYYDPNGLSGLGQIFTAFDRP